jgi:4-amino-4-deoxy-L-arabinose transferase-like glycosyltransferase
MARQLVADRGYTLGAEAPFLPTTWREPGYPLMVSVVYRLVGPSPDVVAGLQAVLLGLTAGLVALIGAQLFGPAVGLVGGALFGLSSESAHYAHWLLTEVLFTLLLMSTLAFALRAQSDGRTRDFLAVGIGLGLTTVVRAVAGSVLFPLVVVLGLAQSRAGRRWPLRAGLIVVAMALVVAPWIGRNWAVVGHPVLASRFGVNLVRRAPRAADPPAAYRDWVKASVWMATNPLSQLIVPMSTFQWGPSYEDNLIWDFHVNDMNRHLMWYEPICNPTPDQEACFVPIGLAFVREYPVGYVVQTVFELVKLHFAPLPGPQALIHNTTVWLGVVAGISLAVRRRLRAPHALVLGSVAAYVAAISLLDTQVRYLLPVLPIYAILAAVPLTSALQTVLRALGAPAGALTSRQANDPVRR